MNRQVSIFIVLVIIGLIFFDSAQQKYYIDTFGLNSGEKTPYLAFLSTHMIRWVLWGAVTAPLSFFVWKKYFRSGDLSIKTWSILGMSYFLATILALILVSLQSLFFQNLDWKEFGEFLKFFSFQKGLSFLMASIMIILLLFNQSRMRTISNQGIEIKNLRRKTSDLQEVINQEETPHLNVKIGYKLTPVALEDIIWIQSDDYCVKIHTEKNIFTLRQSLKTLEEKLAPYRFIRIHRSSLLNINYLDQINFETAKVKLLNKIEIPYSKNGIKSLKEKMKDISA